MPYSIQLLHAYSTELTHENRASVRNRQTRPIDIQVLEPPKQKIVIMAPAFLDEKGRWCYIILW